MNLFKSIYLLLLAYVIVALVFWEISLQNQSKIIFDQEITLINIKYDSVTDYINFHKRLDKIYHSRLARKNQYLGEGATFLIVILIGAYVVYKSLKYHLTLSKQQNNFMLSVTHELKSPLAGIKLNLQTLEKHQLNEQNRKILIERSIKESNRLNDLCNNILFASRLEGGNYKTTKERFNFSKMVEYCFNIYSNRYPNRFILQNIAPCQILGDSIMLEIAINNLMENAAKYSPEEKKIAIKLEVQNQRALLTIIDEGPGIPDVEKKNVFTKFYRSGNEETRKKTGTGLGLYLANKIIIQHKGQLIIKDNKPTGAIFEMTLPIKK